MLGNVREPQTLVGTDHYSRQATNSPKTTPNILFRAATTMPLLVGTAGVGLDGVKAGPLVVLGGMATTGALDVGTLGARVGDRVAAVQPHSVAALAIASHWDRSV